MIRLAPALLLACASRLSTPGATGPAIPVGPDCVQLPVGTPPGEGYYVAQGFGANAHLGEDWNGVGGGNTDLGDAVYAMADGRVTSVEDVGGGWGPVVRIAHRIPGDDGPVMVESLYAHLDRTDVSPGQDVNRGDRVGAIGDAHGRYVAHLHLELRSAVGLPLGPGYSRDATGYLDPRAFVAEHQGGCAEVDVD